MEQYFYFKPRISGSNPKSSGNIADTPVRFKVPCYTVRFKMSSLFFYVYLLFMCYLCEKYYKLTSVQYHREDCISWVCISVSCSVVSDSLQPYAP